MVLAVWAVWFYGQAGAIRVLNSSNINEIKGGVKTAAHLLEFDSVHGRWTNSVECIDDHVVVDQTHKISFSENATPGETDWVGMGCDIVLECTGKFKTPETIAPYFDQGVKKVIVAAPVKEGALNIVYGVNDDLYDPATHNLLTAASCRSEDSWVGKECSYRWGK